jgi:2-amino-4-hydroxy-6-hydroxymethyldihydropteridine diphosphokinase
MNRVFLLTGSNLGDSFNLMKRAEIAIEKEIGGIVQKSHIYKSEPWGFKSSGQFFNQCIEINSAQSPFSILERILEIENAMGRVRGGKSYSDREIDIDILFYGDIVIEHERLIIPHPRVHLRKFALIPLNEIAGEFIHPVLEKSISELLNSCNDESLVTMNH